MINNTQQSGFWEVALTKDRDAFIRGTRPVYTKTGAAVRLDRSAKTNLIVAATAARNGASVARAKARAKLWA